MESKNEMLKDLLNDVQMEDMLQAQSSIPPNPQMMLLLLTDWLGRPHQEFPDRLSDMFASYFDYLGTNGKEHTYAFVRGFIKRLLLSEDIPYTDSVLWKIGTLPKLSDQLVKLYEQRHQTPEEHSQKMKLCSRLFKKLNQFFNNPHLKFYVFGSSVTGLAVRGSDTDICVMNPMFSSNNAFQFPPTYDETEINKLLHNIGTFLMISGDALTYTVIPAKVALLRFTASNGLNVDLIIGHSVGIYNSMLLQKYSKVDHRVAQLVTVVKIWAQLNGVHGGEHGKLSSYNLALMVIFYLQSGSQPVLPNLQELHPKRLSLRIPLDHLNFKEPLHDTWKGNNTQSLGELFLGFMIFYTNFDYNTDVVSVRTARVLKRRWCHDKETGLPFDARNFYICIEEPFTLSMASRAVVSEHEKSRFVDTCRRTQSMILSSNTVDWLHHTLDV